MAKKSTKSTSKKLVLKNATSSVRVADIIAIISSVWFMNSVAMNVYDKVNVDLKNTPASYALALGVITVAYSIANKKRLSFSISFCLGLLVASAFIWYFGLYT